ncbi:hypothetical protein SAMN05421538_103186 [Paracoccus isoporae]|uniref:Uncharacterized protein n=1 Tax=Paracoccus isoporae TaxID=591205 RepID=A0A1G6Z8Y4_9RHOB|nr:hypothetical protein SAMN05421538_103186 [Paracoccus isoporae]
MRQMDFERVPARTAQGEPVQDQTNTSTRS